MTLLLPLSMFYCCCHRFIAAFLDYCRCVIALLCFFVFAVVVVAFLYLFVMLSLLLSMFCWNCCCVVDFVSGRRCYRYCCHCFVLLSSVIFNNFLFLFAIIFASFLLIFLLLSVEGWLVMWASLNHIVFGFSWSKSWKNKNWHFESVLVDLDAYLN